MAYWTRGRTFGTSMCSDCHTEIPYTELRLAGKPDPDTCPHCGADMENGYGNVKRNLNVKLQPALGAIRDEIIPEKYGIANSDEIKIWEAAFKEFIEKLESEKTSVHRMT